MKRTGFAPRQQTLSQRSKLKTARGVNPLKAGQLGERLYGKLDHLRDEKHLILVRAQPCIVSRSLVGVVAHHPDEIVPAMIAQARKISDYLAVPLRYDLHDPATPGSLHRSNSLQWWLDRNINVYAWLRGFLRRHYPTPGEGVQFALEAIAEAEFNLKGTA